MQEEEEAVEAVMALWIKKVTDIIRNRPALLQATARTRAHCQLCKE